jgi:hypothetical protein
MGVIRAKIHAQNDLENRAHNPLLSVDNVYSVDIFWNIITASRQRVLVPGLEVTKPARKKE